MSMSEKLTKNLANRHWLASRLRAEIVGPDPDVSKLDVRMRVEQKSFTWEEFRKPKRQANGEEILWQDPPTKRFGAGVLFPVGVIDELEQLHGDENPHDGYEVDPGDNQDVDEKLEKSVERKAAKIPFAMDESEDYAVTLANAFRPSAIGLSFLADFSIENKGLKTFLTSIKSHCASARLTV